MRLAVLFLFGLALGHAQSRVVLTPAVVAVGSPELVRVSASHADSVEGEWLGHKLDFFRGRAPNTWIALAGVDVEAPIGPSKLTISIHRKEGTNDAISQNVEIHAAHYRTAALRVAPKFVEPDPQELTRIKDEAALKEKIFAQSADAPLWTASFHTPVRAAPTDSFGTRRTFNGTLASIHKGMDFRAATGTVVRAANDGVVALARPLYYEGNCVVLDHGLGLYTLSMHLSRIDVREGETVRSGQTLGLSGATGRATGPHLHWAVRWRGAYLDPAKVLRLPLDNLR